MPSPDAPTFTRPRFHVWMLPPDTDPADADDTDPEYVGVVTITNQDQLMAETQAKGLGVSRESAFHLTNLWLWAAMVRRKRTEDKFRTFTARMEYRPVDDDTEAGEDTEDPSRTAQGPNTG
jgi:hypothetical protein